MPIVAFHTYGLLSPALPRSIRVWDSESGIQLSVIEGHEASVTAVAFCTKTARVGRMTLWKGFTWGFCRGDHMGLGGITCA